MPTFIALVNFTDQGIRNAKDSPKHAAAFKTIAKKLGVSVKNILWTVGSYDIVVIAEGSDEAVTAAVLKLGAAGHVRTQTLRAFSAEEFKKILAAAD